MKSTRHTWGVIALACLAGNANATIVDVIFDVTVYSKLDIRFLTVEPDAAFQPLTFTGSLRLDLTPAYQDLQFPNKDDASARTAFADNTSFFRPTPLTAALKALVPPGSGPNDLDYSVDARYRHGDVDDPNQPTPQVLRMFSSSHFGEWSTRGLDGTGKKISQYMQRLSLSHEEDYRPGMPFTVLSSEDTLAFLRSKIGVIQEDAYGEQANSMIWDDYRPIDAIGTQYQGHVLLRSVTVVPEPGAVVLSLLGAAMVALRVKRKRA